MDKYDLAVDAPFYAWDCITLTINNKWDLYLIIRNEQAMTNFIKLLILKTNTLDGVKDSASMFNKLMSQKLQKDGNFGGKLTKRME